VTLTNDAPVKGLPDYVVLRVDRGNGVTSAPGEPRGTSASLVQVYAAQGAQLLGAKLDGSRSWRSSGRSRATPCSSSGSCCVRARAGRAVLDLVEPAADLESGGRGEPRAATG
jgi:hypothetical protein